MKPIFISGMYKSGTSWLLRIMNQHPQIISLNEIDIAKQATKNEAGTFIFADPETRLENYFSKNSWCHLPKEHFSAEGLKNILSDYQAVSGNRIFDLDDSLAAEIILLICLDGVLIRDRRIDYRSVLPIASSKIRKEIERLRALYKGHKKRGNGAIVDCDLKQIEHFYATVKNATDSRQIMHGFIAMLKDSTWYEKADYVTIKGADQLVVIDRVLEAFPESKKLIIVRDGRDASISAQKYKQLMKERGAAWLQNEDISYLELLKTWAQRVRILLSQTDDTVGFIRYEDLLEKFEYTMACVFDWLNVSYTSNLLQELQEKTSFKNLTGRKPGEEDKHIMRKGVSGEWTEALSEREKKEAWKCAGSELKRLGYTQDSEVMEQVDSSHYLLS